MSYTKIAKVVAPILMSLGPLSVISAFMVSFDPDQQYYRHTGKAIDLGLHIVILGLTLGVLVEISSSSCGVIKKNSDHWSA